MRTIWADIRYGLRMLAASPGFTAVAILSLAIGIGANTSMFSLVDALLLRPLDVGHPNQVVRIMSTSRATRFGGISHPDYRDFRTQTKTLAGFVASQQTEVAFNSDPASPAQLRLGLAVSPDFFDVLEVQPQLGRSFRSDEDRTPVVILSESFWQSQFARDPAIIGRHVSLGKVDFTVVGITPKSFEGMQRFVHESVYIPLGMLPQTAPVGTNPINDRNKLPLDLFGRLAPGFTAAQAQAELQSIARNLERAYPETNRDRSVLAMPELSSRLAMEPEDAVQEGVLLAIAGIVLLIACANVANLLLARARARSREVAIRLAIGASRRRLLQQFLTESLLLALAGGAGGLLLALFAIDFFASIRFPTAFPIWLTARLDLRVLLFALAASVLSGVIFGVAPALKSLNADLTGTLKSGDSPASGNRRLLGRNALAVAQIGLSMTLLVAAGLLVKEFTNLARTNRAGFRVDHVLVLGLDPAVIRYSEPEARTFFNQLVERVRSLPGVRSVALGEHVPLGVSGSIDDVTIEGFEMAPGQHSVSLDTSVVDSQYFTLMQIPIVSGRAFATSDTAASPAVAIVNQAMAEKYWPKRNAIGGRIKLADKTLQVIGIAKTIKYRDVSEPRRPFLYLPFAQHYSHFMTLHVETAGDPSALAAPVQAEVRGLDPGMPIIDIQTVEHVFNGVGLFFTKLAAQMVAIIGLFGLVLAVTGLYGVIAYSVSRRTREIGIRMAIGADPGDVERLVLRQGCKLALIGVGIGSVLALLASKLLESLLTGVSPRDPIVFALMALILAAVSLLACYAPARRAARVDPLRALRHD